MSAPSLAAKSKKSNKSNKSNKALVDPKKPVQVSSGQVRPMESAPMMGSTPSQRLNPSGQKGYYPPSGGGIAFDGIMPIFSAISGVPRGLEPLVGLDTLIVQEQMHFIEVLLNFEMSNQYNILNNYGQRMYFAAERSGCCNRQCCGSSRPFQISLLDGQSQVAVVMERDCNAALCCFGSKVAGTDILVRSGFTNEVYGNVVQNFNCCSPSYTIFDGKGIEILHVDGPPMGTCCTACTMCCDAEFLVYLSKQMAKSMKVSALKQMEGTQPPSSRTDQILVAMILKKFSSLEFVSDANQFGIRFSPNLDPRIKVTLIGAVMAIDFSFFETGSGGGGGGKNDCSVCTCVLIVILLLVTVVGLLWAISLKKGK